MKGIENNPNYETFNKFSFYVAGALFAALMGYQASLQKAQIEITKELAKTNADQKVDIASIAVSLESVIYNQRDLRETVDNNHRDLQNTVGEVERQMINICARSEVCE